MKLQQALEAQTYRHLWAITQARGLNPGRSPTKAGLVALLEAALADAGALRRDLAALSPAERCALDLLLAAPHPLSRYKLESAFGPIRPFQPWQDGAPAHPWLDPSPVERLVYLGLAYPTRARVGGWNAEDCLFVPDDLLANRGLPVPPAPAEQARLPPGQPPALADSDLLHDCFTFLSFLNLHDLAPQHRRWLTLRQFRPLNDRFARPEPLHRDGRAILGEKRTARLRFLHFLLEGAGLVALAGECLKPSPAALPWLQAPPWQRLRTLWRAWDSPGLWLIFDLPRLPLSRCQAPEEVYFGLPDSLPDVETPPAPEYAGPPGPLESIRRLLNHLRLCRPGQVYDLERFIAALTRSDLDLYLLTPGLGYRLEPGEGPLPSAPDVCRELLTRHLRWFGLLALHGDRRNPTAFSLTPAGAALLGLAAPPPDPPAPGPHLRLEPADLSLEAAPTCPPALLYRLEPWVEWLGVRRYRLLPASVNRALQRGGCLDDLLLVLAEGLAAPLPPDLAHTLRGWADAGRAITLRRPILLQTHSRELLDELAAQPTLRAHLAETLSPRHAVVDARDLEGLVRKLRQLGHPPHLTFPLPAADGLLAPARNLDRPGGQHPWGPGGAAHLLLAARVFNDLARLIRPTGRVPAPVLDALDQQLSDRQRETVRQLAAETLDRLLAALDGWTPHGPCHDALPLAESLALVEQALAAARPLEITYWTAGREELTHRTVEPLRLEERHGVPYLVAYCHLRHAERVFRLDRIRGARVLSQSESLSSQP